MSKSRKKMHLTKYGKTFWATDEELKKEYDKARTGMGTIAVISFILMFIFPDYSPLFLISGLVWLFIWFFTR